MVVSQVKNCRKTFESGCLLQILGRITTLRVNLNTAEPQYGGCMVKPSQSGRILAQVPSCGYMGNVSACAVIISPRLIIFAFSAGAGKSILWYNNLCVFSLWKLINRHHPVPQSFRMSAACVN
jgi:hypothetical protein